MLLKDVEVELGSFLDDRFGCLVAVEMDEIVHLEKIVKVHFLAGMPAAIDFIKFLRKLHGSVSWKEGPPEHAMGQGVVAFKLRIDFLEVVHIFSGDRQAHFFS